MQGGEEGEAVTPSPGLTECGKLSVVLKILVGPPPPPMRAILRISNQFASMTILLKGKEPSSDAASGSCDSCFAEPKHVCMCDQMSWRPAFHMTPSERKQAQLQRSSSGC